MESGFIQFVDTPQKNGPVLLCEGRTEAGVHVGSTLLQVQNAASGTFIQLPDGSKTPENAQKRASQTGLLLRQDVILSIINSTTKLVVASDCRT